MEVFLYNSTVCRLCGEENDNGNLLYSTEENDQNLSQIINTYLPITVRCSLLNCNCFDFECLKMAACSLELNIFVPLLYLFFIILLLKSGKLSNYNLRF